MPNTSLLAKFLIWRIKHLSNKNFVLILSSIVGSIAGLAAVILKEVVCHIQEYLTGGFNIAYAHYLYIGYPIVGISIAALIAHLILKEKGGHGLPQVLYAIAKKSSIMPRVKMCSNMITSAFTVGFGGSVGLEAPMVVTGSAIGANIAHLMHLDYQKRKLLLGCGAAGAIAGIFNAPIAGVIFCMEVLLTELSIAAFIPLLMASIAGTLVSMFFKRDNVLFCFNIKDPFVASDVLYYIVMGILCGLISVYFLRTIYTIEARMEKLNKPIKKLGLGGLALGLIIFIFPPIYGEGYATIMGIMQDRTFNLFSNSLFFDQNYSKFLVMLFAIGIVLFKPVAAAFTIGAGGSGGIFGPSLFTGAMAGFAFALGIDLLGLEHTNHLNFMLAGMCGVTSGILQAPLTAIFLIAEISGGYELFVPLMLVSAIAFTTNTYFEKHSIYTKQLAERGELIRNDKDQEVLSLIAVEKIIETDLLTIHHTATLNDLVQLIRRSKRNIFPVINDADELIGLVGLDDVRKIMFDEQLRATVLIKDLMHDPPTNVSIQETMVSIMKKFEQSEAWHLPVRSQEGKYIGFISKATIFNAYRKRLIKQTKE